jgi:ADP-heptose:LPS heptosyltransferase
MTQKLILEHFRSPGDVLMLTAAVRDLHKCYPNRYLTDVRTPCPHLWENNPCITPLRENDPQVTVLQCHYPLIHRSNDLPVHFLNGFVEYLNEQLRLDIRLSAFKGDIHISDREKSWFSQVYEMVGQDMPFWIIVAGGKYDFTIKWWEHQRFQAVVNFFRGKILFVQVGEQHHNHPALDGVLDLRGKTDLRQLVRLMYHAQGVLCPVTFAMHLAAAVEVKEGKPKNRPCVVIAGGREPSQWEAYPHHQFIHTNGALLCCDNGGCWKSRTVPLGDGDAKDEAENLCVDVVGRLPRCMNMITAADVVGRIERYFDGGSIRYLTKDEWIRAALAMKWSGNGKVASREKTADQTRDVENPKPGVKSATTKTTPLEYKHHKVVKNTFAFCSPHESGWTVRHLSLQSKNLFGSKVAGERDFLQKLQQTEGYPEMMLMQSFEVERSAIVSICRELGINVVHGEDGFFPHYSTGHADPIGFCWESSLPGLTFRKCNDLQRKHAKALRKNWLGFKVKPLPDFIKKPFVFWPLQLIGDKVNRWDLNVTDWTGLIAHFRSALPEEYQLVIKEHPLSKPADSNGIAELLPKLPRTVLVPRNTDLKTLLSQCSAVAGANSTVLFEARLLFHKPAYVYARSWFSNHAGLFMPVSVRGPRVLNRLDWLNENKLLRTEYLDDYTDWFLAQLLARQISHDKAVSAPKWFKQTLDRLSYHSFRKYGEEIFLDALEPL